MRVEQAVREEKVVLWVMLLCVVALPISALSSLDSALYLVLLGLSALMILVSLAERREPLDAGLLAFGVAMICYLVVCWVGNGGSAASRLMQYALMVLLLVAISRYRWRSSDIHQLNLVFMALMIASALYWLVSGRATNYYTSFYGHSNGFANVIICAVVIKAMDVMAAGRRVRAGDVAYLTLCLVLLAFANSRSAMFSVLTIVLAFFLFWRLGKKGDICRYAVLLFGAVTAVILVFSIVYPSLYGTQLGFRLELLSREYLNKNFFSGREVVWRAVLEALEGNEVFGLGLSMEPSMIYNTSISSHNLYLQTILQSGVVGLAFVLGLLLLVVVRLSKSNLLVCYLGIALVLGLLVHEGFEVTLTQNNFSYGIAYWMLLGVALSMGRGVNDHG